MARRKHALVIEGGGMKAAYANGVLSAFEEAGHRPFDAIYGTSAGGALAAWYAAGQARYAEKTWEYAQDRRILSFRRALKWQGPLLDHDALLEIVYETEHPLDQEAVARSPQPVIVNASDIHSAEVAYHDLRVGPVIPWLKATGRLPFVAGGPVVIDGRAYLDGGILDPIPVRKAVADGARRLTVLLNTPAGPLKKDNPLLAELCARAYPRLRHGLLWHQDLKAAAIDYLEAAHPDVVVDVIRPKGPNGLHRLGRDLDAIHAGIEEGRADGHLHLDTYTEW